MASDLKTTKRQSGVSVNKVGIAILVAGAIALSSCAGTSSSKAKDNNQSKQRTIVSYLA